MFGGVKVWNAFNPKNIVAVIKHGGGSITL